MHVYSVHILTNSVLSRMTKQSAC